MNYSLTAPGTPDDTMKQAHEQQKHAAATASSVGPVESRAMAFAFNEQAGEDQTRVVRTLKDTDAGSLGTVLDAFAIFLRLSGFPYVAHVAVEYDDGRVVFGDSVSIP